MARAPGGPNVFQRLRDFFRNPDTEDNNDTELTDLNADEDEPEVEAIPEDNAIETTSDIEKIEEETQKTEKRALNEFTQMQNTQDNEDYEEFEMEDFNTNYEEEDNAQESVSGIGNQEDENGAIEKFIEADKKRWEANNSENSSKLIAMQPMGSSRSSLDVVYQLDLAYASRSVVVNELSYAYKEKFDRNYEGDSFRFNNEEEARNFFEEQAKKIVTDKQNERGYLRFAVNRVSNDEISQTPSETIAGRNGKIEVGRFKAMQRYIMNTKIVTPPSTPNYATLHSPENDQLNLPVFDFRPTNPKKWNEHHQEIYENYKKAYLTRAKEKPEIDGMMKFSNSKEATDFFKKQAEETKKPFFYEQGTLKTNPDGTKEFVSKGNYMFSCGDGKLYEGNLSSIRMQLADQLKLAKSGPQQQKIEEGIKKIEEQLWRNPVKPEPPAAVSQTSNTPQSPSAEETPKSPSPSQGLK